MGDDGKSRVEFTVYGEPASKSNGRRWTGKFLIKSEKALNYGDAFIKQCPVLEPLLEGDLRVSMTIFYASRRPDLDASLILDLMQKRIFQNDRQVREQHFFWGLDKENPRAEITVEVI
jgi:Holliday junction resolvase RusA-like endonuclease